MPPVALSLSHLAASISKPIKDILAPIRRSANALPIRPSPMIPTGALGCMLFGFDAGGPGIRRPSDDLAADEGTEFIRCHRGDDDAGACELLAGRGQCQEFRALGMELVDDRRGRSRRRQQSIPDGG